MTKITIEVCCASVDDAVRAYEAGADRIEFNSALFAGGLTPSIGSVLEVRERVPIPIICMIRPRPGGFYYTDLEFETMLCDAAELAKTGVEGFATGCLTQDGSLDAERNAKLVEAASGKEMVFHRAFDIMRDTPEEALPALARIGFKRILSSGREPTVIEGVEMLKRCVQIGGIEILAGGGVRPHNVMEIIQKTGCDQVHFTCHQLQDDTSGKHAPVSFGVVNPPPGKFSIVDPEKLKDFIALIRGDSDQV